ncbi:hypothetical protein HPB50_020824 [Hyalomma asiaticum]|uniref:Uncharacterized protein n=1 Tax=Hyalomma asiaticum TaxID=266040 RepID=A0ACB7S6V8_HYAAI|nr:hypothetical protein HPB50_020824 [Hyalomma asiaticum]
MRSPPPVLPGDVAATGAVLGLLAASAPTAVQQLASPWRRNLGYPLAMLALLSLTVMNMPQPLCHSNYDKVSSKLFEAAKVVASKSMTDAASEVH